MRTSSKTSDIIISSDASRIVDEIVGIAEIKNFFTKMSSKMSTRVIKNRQIIIEIIVI